MPRADGRRRTAAAVQERRLSGLNQHLSRWKAGRSRPRRRGTQEQRPTTEMMFKRTLASPNLAVDPVFPSSANARYKPLGLDQETIRGEPTKFVPADPLRGRIASVGMAGTPDEVCSDQHDSRDSSACPVRKPPGEQRCVCGIKGDRRRASNGGRVIHSDESSWEIDARAASRVQRAQMLQRMPPWRRRTSRSAHSGVRV
jgi:hypothetical protein